MQATAVRKPGLLTSRATKKRKTTRPKLATLLKTGIDSVGKMAIAGQRP